MASKYANVGPVLVTFLGRPRPGEQRGGEETARNQGGGTRVPVTHGGAGFGLQDRGRTKKPLAGAGQCAEDRPASEAEGGGGPRVAPAALTTWGIPAFLFHLSSKS